MAIPVLTSAGAGVGGTGPTIAVPYPATPAAGDLLLLFVALRNLSDTVTTPAGFTLIAGPIDTVGSLRGYLYGVIAAGGETGTLTVTISGTIDKAGRMYRVIGNGTSNEGVASNNDTGSIITDVGVVTSGADRLALNFIATNGTTAGVAAMSGATGGTWAKPISSYEVNNGNALQLDVNSADMATAGTIDGGSRDYTTPSQEVMFGLAVKPLPPPATGAFQ